MAKVTWTIQSLDDLTAIAEYHETTSPDYAALLIGDIFAVEQQLASFPVSGRIVPEANISTFREIVVRGYRVIYAHVDYESVNILAIRSSRIPLGGIGLL